MQEQFKSAGEEKEAALAALKELKVEEKDKLYLEAQVLLQYGSLDEALLKLNELVGSVAGEQSKNLSLEAAAGNSATRSYNPCVCNAGGGRIGRWVYWGGWRCIPC